MTSFGERRPVVFEIILIIAGFVLALVFGLACQVVGVENELAMGIGRIAAGILLILVFFRCFEWKRQFSGILIMLPALLFAAWNVCNHFITGGGTAPLSLEILILGLAPAIFEEVIFRGIFLHNLEAKGRAAGDLGYGKILFISAFFFAVIHLTNAVSGDVAQALVQTGYAFVIGLVFGAIYLRTNDLLSVIIAHAAIDITNRCFMADSNTSTPVLIAFLALLLVEAVYAVLLVRGMKRKNLSA